MLLQKVRIDVDDTARQLSILHEPSAIASSLTAQMNQSMIEHVRLQRIESWWQLLHECPLPIEICLARFGIRGPVDARSWSQSHKICVHEIGVAEQIRNFPGQFIELA